MNYLYVIHIPITLKNGIYSMPRSAAIDINAHRRLLPASVQFTLAAPLIDKNKDEIYNEPFDPIPNIEIVPLSYINSFQKGVLPFFKNYKTLRNIINKADFIHTGGGGFPLFFSPCFWAHQISLKKCKPLLFVMDCDLVGKLEADQIKRTSNLIKKIMWILYAKLSWKLYTNCLSTATVTFLLGQGVVSRYGKYANNPLEIYQPIIGLEWLINRDDLNKKIRSIKNESILKICYVGRLAPEKGLNIMIEALAMLKLQGLSFEVNIYGEGPNKTEYEDLRNKLNLSNNIHFHGFKEWGKDLFQEFRKNHIQIVPHLTLEMTRNVFDGMASGCALIVSNTAALKKLIDDSHSGVMFETNNPSSLAEVTKNLINNRDTLIKYIKNSIDFVKENHRDAHIQRRLNYLQKKISKFQIPPFKV